MYDLIDMHMHAGFAPDPRAFSEELAELSVAAFSNTVTPLEYLELSPALFGIGNVRLGVGMHPWWIGTEETISLNEVLMLFEDGLDENRFVGEVGLDFLPKHEHTIDEQLVIFKNIAAICAEHDGVIMSMHAVRAERELLDVLETTGTARSCTCILHSYSGPSDQLTRAIDLGCMFSMGKRTLSTKKGREYARVVPEDRLLIESDGPDMSGTSADASAIAHELMQVIEELARIRQCERGALAADIRDRSARILGLE